MRQCSKCREYKVRHCFNKDKKSSEGLSRVCKECRSNYRRLKFEEISQYNQEYRLQNLDKEKEKDRANNLKASFNLSIKEWEDMYEKQGKKCFICPKKVSGPNKRLCVDHCHKTGKIRGLLCDTCNRALGLLNDDTNLLRTAISYLENTEVEDKKPLR
jgi:hypothetical protein